MSSNTLTPFDALVRHAFGPSLLTRPRPTGFTPAAEIARDGDDAVLRLELPGVDVSKDVSVEVKDERLVVRGERRDERSSDKDGRTLREVRYGSFRRSFALPHEFGTFVFQVDCVNVWNKVKFGDPNTAWNATIVNNNITAYTGSFGQISSASGSPRDFQFSGHFNF